jgi:hypothetical protein
MDIFIPHFKEKEKNFSDLSAFKNELMLVDVRNARILFVVFLQIE